MVLISYNDVEKEQQERMDKLKLIIVDLVEHYKDKTYFSDKQLSKILNDMEEL